jgi:hypothetical protein
MPHFDNNYLKILRKLEKKYQIFRYKNRLFLINQNNESPGNQWMTCHLMI